MGACKGCWKAYVRSRPYDKEYERQRDQTEKREIHLYANLKRGRRENPHKMAVPLAWSRARKLEAEGGFKVEEFEVLCERYGACACAVVEGMSSLRRTTSYRSRSGGIISDIQPLCGPCNSWKNVKVVDYRRGGPPHKLQKRALPTPRSHSTA